jgi:Fe-S-cluster containining protein
MIQEHNFKRTECACQQCTACCKRQPGSLAPGDLERIAGYIAEKQELTPEVALREVKRQLWASPGGLYKDMLSGKVTRVGTITPRFRRGRCIFLDANDRCSIHPVAPFACAYFDTHMSAVTAMPRSLWLIRTQEAPEYQALRNELPYATHHKPISY